MGQISERVSHEVGLVEGVRAGQSHPLDAIFRPRSVAVVGASPWVFGASGAGAAFIRALQELGFPLIYPVNPKHEEIEGLKCYPDLLSIDGPVDHVISAVPAKAVSSVLEQVMAKGSRTLHLFTAGFSETGEDGAEELEKDIAAKAVQAGVRVLGPNCMGLYVPAARLSFTPGMPAEPGPVAMISQSGTNAGEMVRSSAPRGIRFSKVVSYGNGSDIGANELLEYLAQDPETEIITAYVEGIGDGRGLMRALGKAAAVKPMIILKGGRTLAGGRAAYSHTASLAGSTDVFDAACRQAGAIQVSSVDEMVTGSGPPLHSRNYWAATWVVGGGGGFSVYAADEVRAGLECPPLPEETQAELWGSYRSPGQEFATLSTPSCRLIRRGLARRSPLLGGRTTLTPSCSISISPHRPQRTRRLRLTRRASSGCS
jgi:acyl-CoA synthetase (NDP forming)